MQKLAASAESPGRIEKMDPPWGSVIYTIGVLESRIGGSVFWILPGLWEAECRPSSPMTCRAFPLAKPTPGILHLLTVAAGEWGLEQPSSPRQEPEVAQRRGLTLKQPKLTGSTYPSFQTRISGFECQIPGFGVCSGLLDMLP